MCSAGPGLVVVTGANGAGKTNILEALSLLAPGRGLRGAPLTEMASDGGGQGFSIAARCEDPMGDWPPVSIGTGTNADAPGKRRVRINGAHAAAATLAEWLAMVWLTPSMDRLFADAASQRRRFLDRMTLAMAPGHAQHSNRYEAAMRARTRLLADDRPADPAWLDALEAQMAEHGAAMDGERRRLVAALSREVASAPPSPFARPTLALTGPDEALAEPWDQGALAGALQASRKLDAAAGRALTGPHRVDLSVRHADKDQAAHRCSTGEQKALLLSIVLAHGDLIARARGQRPILLLDELAAHLDPMRRATLFDRLAASGGQVWMTGTEAELFAGVAPDSTHLHVESGTISGG